MIMKLYKLAKTVLSLRKNPAQFLNGLTSNSLDKPRNAFLNVHGRIVATFDQLKIDDDEVWIVLGSMFVKDALNHLDRYIKLSGLDVQVLEKYVYMCPEDDIEVTGGVIRSIPQTKGHMILSDDALEAQDPDDQFALWRLRHNMPLQGVDYTDEFILNVGNEEFVSFAKGCFLGQEPVSKVHNRSRPTWQLVVKYEDECDGEEKQKMTSKVLDPDANRVLGFTFTRNT